MSKISQPLSKAALQRWIGFPLISGIALTFIVKECSDEHGGLFSKLTKSKELAMVSPLRLDVECPFCKKASKGKIFQEPGFVVCIHCSKDLTDLKMDDRHCLRQPPDFFEGYIPGGHFKMERELIANNISEKKNQFLGGQAIEAIIIKSWFDTYKRIVYAQDPQGMDIWNRAAKTWDGRKGDCEDHAILLANLLLSQGLKARVAVGRWKQEFHAWVVLSHNGKEYLLEQIGRSSRRFPPRVQNLSKEYIPLYAFDQESTYYPSDFRTMTTSYFSEDRWIKIPKLKHNGF